MFVEIRPDTLNLDESRIEAALTASDSSPLLVHYGGVACEMGPIMALAEAHDLKVVEDAARGGRLLPGACGGNDRPPRTYSFHETKNLVCGEGRALCCNAPELIERGDPARQGDQPRQRFFRGEVDKYTWVDVGSSAIPSEIACLPPRPVRGNGGGQGPPASDRCGAYREGLASLEAAERKLRLPAIPEGRDSSFPPST